MNSFKAFIIAIVGLLMLAILSCRSVQKSSSSNTQSKDSTGYTITNDSVSKKSTESTQEKQEQESKNEAGVSVYFDDEDVDTSAAPISIQKLDDGTIVIQPGGRKIKKVNGQFNQSTRTTNSKQQSKEISQDSSSQKKQAVNVQQKSTTKQREKDKTEIPWLGLVALALFMLALYYIIKRVL